MIHWHLFIKSEVVIHVGPLIKVGLQLFFQNLFFPFLYQTYVSLRLFN